MGENRNTLPVNPFSPVSLEQEVNIQSITRVSICVLCRVYTVIPYAQLDTR